MTVPYRPIVTTLLLMIVIAPLAIKMSYVDKFLYSYTGTRLFGAIQVFLNDAIILATVMTLFYLSYVEKVHHAASIFLRVIALIVVICYSIDLYLIVNFNTHLVISDAIKYSPYALKYLQQVYKGDIPFLLILLLFMVWIYALLVFSRQKIRNRVIHIFSIVAISGLFLISSLAAAGNGQYVHAWIFSNFVDHNLVVSSESKKYGPEFVDHFGFHEEKSCYTRTPERPNIVLLMVESLSSYQSNHFSGIRDWTPSLDQIARSNSSYKNFYANGFTTEDGEIALLTGLLPIYRPSSYSNNGGIAFKGFFDIEESLPRVLAGFGYRSEFLTSADLGFADTRNWAESMGFDYIEGHEHPYYEDWNRFHFNAAPDEALYNRVIERLEQNASNRHFIFIKTVSTHHPFINPETGNRSEEEAFRYADRQIGLFYERLENLNFFDEGMLIIVGDHHSMIPLKTEETELFGSHRASAIVPMIVSHRPKRSAVVTEQYQQVDIFNSLKGLTSGKQCYSEWEGDIFGGNPAQYIAHRRGDFRNRISVFSREKVYSVKLDGDYTGLSGDELVDKETEELIVSKINAVRILENR